MSDPRPDYVGVVARVLAKNRGRGATPDDLDLSDSAEIVEVLKRLLDDRPEWVADLLDRMDRAAAQLHLRANAAVTPAESQRLNAKAEGVTLARSYLFESMQRAPAPHHPRRTLMSTTWYILDTRPKPHRIVNAVTTSGGRERALEVARKFEGIPDDALDVKTEGQLSRSVLEAYRYWNERP